LDPNIFSDARVPNVFAVKYTEDVTIDGVYPISYKAYHTSYPSNSQELRPAFTITIIDPCDAPVSVIASNLVNQEYTITQTAFDYQVPAYAADPVWCAIIYDYTIVSPSGDAALSFDPAT